jgi:Asp-tRNA(Asn)/Glu-tRNA(Gln) amidotransferase C subunit
VVDLNKIEKEVNEIINNFVKKLSEVYELKNIDLSKINGKDFYLIQRNNLRKEGEKKEIYKKGKEFREKWFKVAPNHDNEYIIAEKAHWKK